MAIIRLIRIERSIDVPALSKWVVLVIVGDKSGLCLEDIMSAIGSLSPHQHRCYLLHNTLNNLLPPTITNTIMPAIRHNPHNHRTALGSADPYPTLANLRARSDTSSPDDSFKDFCIKDYVIAIKRISRRKLHEIDIDNYQRSLLTLGEKPHLPTR